MIRNEHQHGMITLSYRADNFYTNIFKIIRSALYISFCEPCKLIKSIETLERQCTVPTTILPTCNEWLVICNVWHVSFWCSQCKAFKGCNLAWPTPLPHSSVCTTPCYPCLPPHDTATFLHHAKPSLQHIVALKFHFTVLENFGCQGWWIKKLKLHDIVTKRHITKFYI